MRIYICFVIASGIYSSHNLKNVYKDIVINNMYFNIRLPMKKVLYLYDDNLHHNIIWCLFTNG